mgnify:CR=1 FL=1
MHKLRHPNTLKFYNWYATRSHVWLILEYVTGGNLHTLLEQDKRLPESVIKVARAGRGLCSGGCLTRFFCCPGLRCGSNGRPPLHARDGHLVLRPQAIQRAHQ